jgi:hypothetical protein
MMTQPAPTTALIIGPERQDSKLIVAADPEQGPVLLAILARMAKSPPRRGRADGCDRRSLMNARYCPGGLLDRNRPWPTQRLSAWKMSITLVPSPLRLDTIARDLERHPLVHYTCCAVTLSANGVAAGALGV